MNPQTKLHLKTLLLLLGIAAFFAVIAGIISGCKASVRPASPAIAKLNDPLDPCPECPKCTNCIPTNTWPMLDTNGIWLEVIYANMVVPDTNAQFNFYFVTKAHNLTNGLHYRWWRTDNFGLLEWIPLSTFTATTNWAIRTNGIAAPNYHFVRIEQY